MSKHEAIDRVELGNAEWIDKAEKLATSWLRRRRGSYVQSDSLWSASRAAGLPREPRAMGALVRRLQRSGVIEPLQIWRPSTRRECHGRPTRVWRVV